MRTRLRPYLSLVRRTVLYSVGIGAPSFVAYFWLHYYFEFGRFPTQNLSESLLFYLIFALVLFILLGAFVGILIAIVTAICHRRISNPARYRLLIALVLFLPSVLCFLLGLRDDDYVIWGSILNPHGVRTDVIGRWLLATTIAVAICQLVANRYDLEVSSRKTDQSTAMWRALPLFKMVVLVVAVCAVLSVAVLTMQWWISDNGLVFSWSRARLFKSVLADGTGIGLILGSGMALIIMLCFDEIRRPRTYRATMLMFALIVVIYTRRWAITDLPSLLKVEKTLPLALHALSIVAPVILSHFAAGRYLRAVTSGKTKTADKTQAAALSSAPPADDPAPRAPG